MKKQVIIWAVIIVVVLLLAFIVFNRSPTTTQGTTPSDTDTGDSQEQNAGQTPPLDSSDEVFDEIDNALEYIE
jgi:cytoskeletal protein RodZ